MARKRNWNGDLDDSQEYRRFRHHRWPREYAGQPVDSYYQEPSHERADKAEQRELKRAWMSQPRTPQTRRRPDDRGLRR